MTKAQTEWRPAKIKGYVHWNVDEWIKIQALAKENNVPNHWVILAAMKFATHERNIHDFKGKIGSIFDELRREVGSSEYLLWSSEREGNLKCPFCGFEARNKKGFLIHVEKACKKRPLEALMEVKSK